MKFLTPLGLLGLLGILVLILIYIIKPNFQQKFVSSTYIWKLSLKYKKKRIPTSKIRDLLLIICQILVLTGAAAALATPVQVLREQPKDGEVIAIIDSSASMRTITEKGTTRFENAVSQVSDLAETVFGNKGVVSVVLADTKPEFLAKKVSFENRSQVDNLLAELAEDPAYCSYGAADIDSAMELCEEIVADNPNIKIYLYTDTRYTYVPGNVQLMSVADSSSERNAAILSADAKFEAGYYKITVKVASYGSNIPLTVNVSVSGANAVNAADPGERRDFTYTVDCDDDQTETIVFSVSTDDSNLSEEEREHTNFYPLADTEKFYSYHSILVSIDEEDNFTDDNTFSIYGGQKEELRIVYYTGLKNPFVTSALLAIQRNYADQWDVKITDVVAGNTEVELKDYDLYIFEHTLPGELPKDGAIIMINPPGNIPGGTGLVYRGSEDLKGQPAELVEEFSEDSERSAVLNGVDISKIFVTKYSRIDADESYKVLASCLGDPVIMLRDNDIDTKIAVLNFSLHYSNLPLLTEFPVLMSNMFKHFLPPTVVGNSFEVGVPIEIKSRGDKVVVSSESGDSFSEKITSFPYSLSLSIPGTYKVEQTGYMGKEAPDMQIYVKIPAAESNIFAAEDALYDPFKQENQYDYFGDLLIYLAAAIFALLFIEWILQLRDNM